MFLTAATVGLLLAATPAPASETPTLRIGDKPPPIEIEHWLVMPEGAKEFVTPGDGKIYILDFWATWCAPCIADMPHMSELQKAHEKDGVVVIGVSDEAPETINTFLDKPFGKSTRRESLGYIIAADPDKSTHEQILIASSDYTIPRAVVIGREGEIEWIGHPATDQLDDALQQIIAGTWDRNAWRDLFEGNLSFDKQFADLLTAESWEEAAELAGEDWQRLNDIAWRIAFDPEGKVKNRDFRLAQNYATTSLQISNGAESFPIFTLAQVEAERGNYKNALELVERALKVEGGSGPWKGFYEDALMRWTKAAAEQEAAPSRRRR